MLATSRGRWRPSSLFVPEGAEQTSEKRGRIYLRPSSRATQRVTGQRIMASPWTLPFSTVSLTAHSLSLFLLTLLLRGPGRPKLPSSLRPSPRRSVPSDRRREAQLLLQNAKPQREFKELEMRLRS